MAGILITILFQYQSTKTFTYFINYKNWFSTQLTNGFPPSDINSCTVILGAKFVGPGHALIDPLAALSGARHLFANYFLNQTDYGIIEGNFIKTNYGYRGLSTAHIRLHGWEHGGLQWKVPAHQCPEFIQCLHRKTIAYHHSSLPYHFLFGPNSNSFMWWIFHQCSIKITPVFSKYPFVGIDYFWSHNFSSN
jgi:hypothetical protein